MSTIDFTDRTQSAIGCATADLGIPQSLVDPAGRAIWLKLVDSPREFRGEPGTIPYWFLALCLAGPVVVAIWHWSRKIAAGLDAWDWYGLLVTCLSIPGICIVVYFLNQRLLLRGPFFILDKTSGMLALPRVGVVLRKADIRHFAELHVWHKSLGERVRLGEVIAVQQNGDGTIGFLSVAVDDNERTIHRVAQRLAEHFSVPLVVDRQLLWRTGRSRDEECGDSRGPVESGMT